MGVTVYVEGWADLPYEEVKEYIKDKYPEVSVELFEHDPYVQKDENGIYEMSRKYSEEYPEVDFTNDKWIIFVKLLKLKQYEGLCGEVSFNDLPSVVKDLIKIINIEKLRNKVSVVSEVDENILYGAFSSDAILRKSEKLLALIKFAQEKQVGIYWG